MKWSPHNWVGFHPLYTLTTRVFFIAHMGDSTLGSKHHDGVWTRQKNVGSSRQPSSILEWDMFYFLWLETVALKPRLSYFQPAVWGQVWAYSLLQHHMSRNVMASSVRINKELYNTTLTSRTYGNASMEINNMILYRHIAEQTATSNKHQTSQSCTGFHVWT